MKDYIIKEDLLGVLNNYLGNKPFKEVAGLIAALNQLELREKNLIKKETKK